MQDLKMTDQITGHKKMKMHDMRMQDLKLQDVKIVSCLLLECGDRFLPCGCMQCNARYCYRNSVCLPICEISVLWQK